MAGWPALSALLLQHRRVHISQSTLDCLKGEFDVEPGEGGSRCDYLEEKGIETYLIIASQPAVKATAQNGLHGSVSRRQGAGSHRKGPEGCGGPGRSPPGPQRAGPGWHEPDSASHGAGVRPWCLLGGGWLLGESWA